MSAISAPRTPFLLTPLREGRRGLRIARKGLSHFYSRPCGRGDAYARAAGRYDAHFYSRPCGRGDITAANMAAILARISTHAPAGGATSPPMICAAWHSQFLLTPLREGRPECVMRLPACIVFLLTPLREGRLVIQHSDIALVAISTHAPAGGATKYAMERGGWSSDKFLLTPLREGRLHKERFQKLRIRFLLTPLREGRRVVCSFFSPDSSISTHAPAGGATKLDVFPPILDFSISTHAPAGGATHLTHWSTRTDLYFYSRPCGRGDQILLPGAGATDDISTHAPAGGATRWPRRSARR